MARPKKTQESKAEKEEGKEFTAFIPADTHATTPSKLDWREEVKMEYLYLNKDVAARYKLIDNAKKFLKRDDEVAILESLDFDHPAKTLLLQFFKDLAHKQGFHSIRYIPTGNSSFDYAGFSCEILWQDGTVSSGVGDAHPGNCFSFTKHYCGPIAENRAFIRSVKSYFNIPILGRDEIGPSSDDEDQSVKNRYSQSTETATEKKTSSSSIPSPQGLLEKVVKEKLNIKSFDDFKSYLRGKVTSGESGWLEESEFPAWKKYESFGEIPESKCMGLIGKIKAAQDT